jgi:hypothetical protein
VKASELTARTVDDKRRVVMPEECPPNALVIIQQLDKDTWLVRRPKRDQKFKSITLPIVENLPNDPEWDKVELGLAKAASKRLPEPEE